MSGLYIHIPFCLQKCLYCDFYSITSKSAIPSFVQALVREMELVPPVTEPFDTVYFGGGTPSLLAPAQVGEILDQALSRFSIEPDAEISMEANPGTLTKKTLAGFLKAGINRINVGVQSFNDHFLKFLGRAHNAKQAAQALLMARDTGFKSVGCDLIYGICGQTKETWQDDIRQALSYDMDHLSCYMLTYEKNTPLDKMRLAGQFSPMDDDLAARLFLQTAEFLQDQGFVHYEISNFAKTSSYRCRHNLTYWNHAPYLGLGPAAHSFFGDKRHWNVADVDKYIQSIRQGRAPVQSSEILTKEQHILEWLYLGLRQSCGIDINAFEKRFDVDFDGLFGQALAQFYEQGMIADKPKRCALTTKGMLFSDSICKQMAQCF